MHIPNYTFSCWIQLIESKTEILSDKFYLEIFVNGGRKVLSTNIYPDEEANLLSMFAMDGKCIFNNVIIWDLSGLNKE